MEFCRFRITDNKIVQPQPVLFVRRINSAREISRRSYGDGDTPRATS